MSRQARAVVSCASRCGDALRRKQKQGAAAAATATATAASWSASTHSQGPGSSLAKESLRKVVSEVDGLAATWQPAAMREGPFAVRDAPEGAARSLTPAREGERYLLVFSDSLREPPFNALDACF